MGVYIPNMSKPKGCGKCEVWSLCHYPKVDKGYDDKVMPDCPLIEIDLERDIPTVWYNRQTGQYEPKGTKQEVYERLYKLKNGERRE